MEYVYDGSLEGLFRILDGVCGAVDPAAALPGGVRGPSRRGRGLRAVFSGLDGGGDAAQPELFGEGPDAGAGRLGLELPPVDAAFLAAAAEPVMAGTVPDIAAARRLGELSDTAYECFVQGWMSELPLEAELVRFAWRVLDAGQRAPGGPLSPEARRAAEAAAADRGDPDTETALAAAYKVWKELDRLRGLLRFSPNRNGVHIARCAPDHFVLPALAGSFRVRFGEAPWGIIDERRGLALVRGTGVEARLLPLGKTPLEGAAPDQDPWEELWRSYHRIIVNEDRVNPRLQRQFMPGRYWKYLPEARK
jgi:hypothetical protein